MLRLIHFGTLTMNGEHTQLCGDYKVHAEPNVNTDTFEYTVNDFSLE